MTNAAAAAFEARRFRTAAAHYLAGRVLERVGVVERREVTVAQLVDRALSLSSTSRARLGARADEMVAELHAVLARSAPDGVLTEVTESSALLARRRAV